MAKKAQKPETLNLEQIAEVLIQEPETVQEIEEHEPATSTDLSEALESRVLDSNDGKPIEPTDDDVVSYAKQNGISLGKAGMFLENQYAEALDIFNGSKSASIKGNFQGLVVPIVYGVINALNLQGIYVDSHGNVKYYKEALVEHVQPEKPSRNTGPVAVKYQHGNTEWTGRGMMSVAFLELIKKDVRVSTWTEDRIKESFSSQWKDKNRTEQEHKLVNEIMDQYLVK